MSYTLLYHPLIREQLSKLRTEVEALKRKHPSTYRQHAATKRLAAILKLTREVIPSQPMAPQFRQGHTLGSAYTHWFRAKFFGQYRLFYRVEASAKIIVYVWVNDEDSLRSYGSKHDAYNVFRKMLEGGNPPDDFAALLQVATVDE